MRSIIAFAACVALLVPVVAYGSISPITRGGAINLNDDQGIAAIIVDTAQPIRHLFLAPDGHYADSMEIRRVLAGKTLYLFVVEAGRYCLDGFMYGAFAYNGDNEPSCFSVPAGRIGYGGIYMLFFNGVHQFAVHYIYDVESFDRLIQRDYPEVAANFLPSFTPDKSHAAQRTPDAEAQASEPQAGTACDEYKTTCSWIVPVPGSAAQAIVIQNNSIFPIWIWTMRLYACVNVKRDCKALVFNVKLPAKSKRPFLMVRPRDAARKFTYRYHFVWHNEKAREALNKPGG